MVKFNQLTASNGGTSVWLLSMNFDRELSLPFIYHQWAIILEQRDRLPE
jgi:hypothetical protein